MNGRCTALCSENFLLDQTRIRGGSNSSFVSPATGCSKRRYELSDIAEKVRIVQSSASRNVAALVDQHWLKTMFGQMKSCPGLVEIRTDPMELRKKQVFLTPKGKRLIEELQNMIEK